ncbi:MAG: PLP-dependent transferase, partial [Micrococcales bacterium]|nr:PLP-dependent transferase [Micrococcales bacterium]
ELGADVVIHSTTKYINGHSDVVGGAIISRTQELDEQMDFWSNVLGTTGGAFDSYQTLRGLRSVHTRLRAHEENAMAVADLFVGHPAVAATYFPGLPDHPGHDLAARQQDGFGGMVSADLVGGAEAVRAFVDGLQCFSLAESLGGTESLVDHPATMTHLAMTPEARYQAGIGDGLLRFSVGIEDADDLVADLTAALRRAQAAIAAAGG